MADKITWSNERRKLSDLIPWDINPAQINKKQAERLEESLELFGQIQTLAISPTNEIYDGHQRQLVWGASQKYGGDYEVDVRVASRELTEQERKKLIIYLRKGAVGEFDFDILAKDLTLWDNDDPLDDPGAQIDKAEELREKWGVELGQLWQLGEHRLICGDCTDASVVERVMGGERAQAVISDPPFAVRDDEWDKFEGNGFIEFTALWLSIADKISEVVISFMADHNVPLLLEAAASVDLPFRRSLVWRKPPGSQFAGASLDGFWFDFEMINVFKKPTFKPSKDTKMAVLEHRTVTGQEHGCEKPVALLEDLINGYSQPEMIVADMFLGTGTVLVACERLNRKCRAVEISPAYCAVAIQRWVDMIGSEPVLLGNTAY